MSGTPETAITLQPQGLSTGDPAALLQQAVASGASIDTLERLMALRKEVLAEQAKQAFNEAMAAFQEECPVIEKKKGVKTKSGAEAYRYAPIDSIVSQVKHVIRKHGFRYSTTMQLGENKVKVICRVVHAMGHEEVSEMEVPLGNKTDIMSQSQVVAAASTFAKRYAFLNAFGIMTGDDDDDTSGQRGDQQDRKPQNVQQGRGQQGSAPAPRSPAAPAQPAKKYPSTPAQQKLILQKWQAYMEKMGTKLTGDVMLASTAKHLGVDVPQGSAAAGIVALIDKASASKLIDKIGEWQRQGIMPDFLQQPAAAPATAEQPGNGMDPLWAPEQQKVFMLWKEFCKLKPEMDPVAGLVKLLQEKYGVDSISEMRPSAVNDCIKKMEEKIKEMRKAASSPSTK